MVAPTDCPDENPPVPGIRVLGSIELGRPDGITESVGSPRLRLVLAVLAASAGGVVSADRLAELLWGELPPADPGAALHTVISRLRTRLDTVGLRDRLLTRAPGYLLRLGPTDCDATFFTDLVAQAGRRMIADEPFLAAELIDKAMSLWRGDGYAEFAGFAFAVAESVRLAEIRSTAMELRIDAALALDRPAEAIGLCEREVGRNPLRERPRAQLMLALHRAGRTSDALEAFRQFRAVLDEEIGLSPTVALTDLHEKILRHDPGLGLSAEASAAAAGAQESRTRRSGGNLPVRPPVLVGRRSEIADLNGLLTTERLVTVTGPGGVGKTQLALAVAGLIREEADRPDGVWLIELAALRPGAPIAEAIGTVLEVSASAGRSAVQRLTDYLAAQRCLLVLDNGEHVIDDLVRFVSAVLDRCPDVSVLVTSQVPLNLPREKSFPLSPLDTDRQFDAGEARLPAAVQLFVERATRLAPGFDPTEQSLVDIGELCRRLDGLPLAIELAAGRMRHMTPAEVLDRLHDRFRLLRATDRLADARHRTLRSVVEWSYGLLDPAEQELFDQLSVFRGGFGFADAAAVAAAPVAAVIDLIGTLVDRCMLQATPGATGTTFAMLETLRAFGDDRLTARRQDQQARRAHAEHLLRLVRKGRTAVATDECGPWVRAVAAAFDDLRAAHTWASDNDLRLALELVTALPDWLELQVSAELVGWAEQTARRSIVAGPDDPDIRRLTVVALGMAASGGRFGGDLNRALDLADDAVALLSDPEDPVLRYPLCVRSEVNLYLGRLDECVATAERAAPLAERAGDLLRTKWCVMNRLLALAYGDRSEEALLIARDLVQQPDHTPLTRAWADYTLGEVLMSGDPRRAGEVLEGAVAQARRLSDRFLIGVALLSAASLRARGDDPVQAVPLLREVVEHWHRIGNWTQRWTTFRTIADLLERLGDAGSAALLVGAARAETRPAQAFGPDAQRLDELQDRLLARLGADRLAARLADGRSLTDDDAFQLVRQALARADALVDRPAPDSGAAESVAADADSH